MLCASYSQVVLKIERRWRIHLQVALQKAINAVAVEFLDERADVGMIKNVEQVLCLNGGAGLHRLTGRHRVEDIPDVNRQVDEAVIAIAVTDSGN